jgi:membrane-bound lytic murein transglycosylase D
MNGKVASRFLARFFWPPVGTSATFRYIVDWLTRIPPMVSALAFGYGVGMAAPDSALSDVRTTVGSYGARAAGFSAGARPLPHPYAGYGPTYAGPAHGMPAYPLAAAPHGPGHYHPPSPPLAPEPGRLTRLRAMGGSREHHSCSLHQPSHSRQPAPVSRSPYDEDLSDLDAAGHEALSKLQMPDFSVPITRRTLKYVRFLTRSNRGRDLFSSWMRRSGRYAEMVQQTLRERKLPEDLIWVAMIESGFRPDVKSPAGAMGLWQFMKSTGGVYGLRVNRYVDLRKDPRRATEAAARHLRDLHQRFGAWELALAAYNMGYQQLLRAIDRYNTTDFNELARQRAIPSETANYVPKIIAAAVVANNLERYGFGDVKVYNPIHTAELTVPGGTPVKIVAKAAGISTGRFRSLNPHLLTKFVPPGREFGVYVPAVKLARARASLPALVDDRIAMDDGDILAPTDLWGIGGKKDKHLRRDAWSHGENMLRFLPKPKRRSLRSMLRNKPAKRPDERALAPLAAEFGPKRAGREIVMYRVGSGDTLIGIAKQFAIDVDDLARDNEIDPADRLRKGALLWLMVKKTVLQRWRDSGKARTLREARLKRKSAPTANDTKDASRSDKGPKKSSKKG